MTTEKTPEKILEEAVSYGPDAQSLVQDALFLYAEEKDKVNFLLKFIEHYSREGHDNFGFLIEARKVIKKFKSK